MNRNSYFKIIIPLVALSLLVIFLLLLPKYEDLKISKKEILNREFELKTQEEHFKDLQQLSAELKKYEISLAKIDSALPENPSLSGLFNFIQKIASQSGLTLKAISPPSTSVIADSKIKETTITLTLVGEYPQLKNFLSVLEKSARFVEVENVSFSFPKEGPFNFNITIKVYSY